MQLRPYQSHGVTGVYDAWQMMFRNVCLVEPTGAGKTIILAHIIKEHNAPTCVIAHRQELVQQISTALAREGVFHRVLASAATVKNCIAAHYEECGRDYYNMSSNVVMAGVDTLNIQLPKKSELQSWAKTVTLVVQDESHHVLRDNKWGKAAAWFTNLECKGLYVTATPTRADGKGLGRWADGIMDTMVVGPTMRELINMGFLTDYRIWVPPSDIDLSDSKLGKQGDFTDKGAKAVEKSHIVGDVVEHYKKIAMGKLGVTFVPSIELAEKTAKAFNDAGVPALAVSGKMSDGERNKALRKFKNREVLQLINVDLFGEGFDLPAIEVISFARPTMSYALYCQQFGRALRLLKGKKYAIIIDHVGNVVRHGLPDATRNWTLDRRGKKSKKVNDAIPVTVCPECLAAYERTHRECPYCGYYPEPQSRSEIKFVDGDLHELTPEALAALRHNADEAVKPPEEYREDLLAKFCPEAGIQANVNRHKKRIEALTTLKSAIAQWAGYEKHYGYKLHESYRRFYHIFGIDVLSAQALKTPDAEELTKKVENYY